MGKFGDILTDTLLFIYLLVGNSTFLSAFG